MENYLKLCFATRGNTVAEREQDRVEADVNTNMLFSLLIRVVDENIDHLCEIM